MRVHVSAEEALGDVLPGGPTGPGLDNEAEVELYQFEYPAVTFPAYDKDGTKAVYAFFNVKLTQTHGPKAGKSTFEKVWFESDRLAFQLKSIGVHVDVDETTGSFEFDSDDCVGLKLTGVELKEPRTYNGRQYTGNIKGFIGN